MPQALHLVTALSAALALSGCSGVQSALEPAGDDAARTAILTWVLVIGSFVILSLVVGLTAFAIWARPEQRVWLGQKWVVVAGGVLLPVLSLSALLIYAFAGADDRKHVAPDPTLQIEVTGEQFWWRVRYRRQGDDTTNGDSFEFSTANELHIPVGIPVELLLRTNDVIHSFWVPSLAGKLDMIPGQLNRLVLRATREGIYRGQCAEYCGDQHAQMAFYVVAQEEEEFRRWMSAQRRPAANTTIPSLQAGQRLFIASGCGACHTVRGTEALGSIGPDLTHIGSRRSLGAGILPNNVGTLAAWIASSQHLKPGNKMPSFNVLQGNELRAISDYLESLK